MQYSSAESRTPEGQCLGCQAGCAVANAVVDSAGDSGNANFTLPAQFVVQAYMRTLLLPWSGFISLTSLVHVLGFAEVTVAICGAVGLTTGIWLNRWYDVNDIKLNLALNAGGRMNIDVMKEDQGS